MCRNGRLIVLIKMNLDEIEALRERLSAFEDAELIDTGEYVVDLYDEEDPMSLEVLLTEDGADVLAAEHLAYDEELRGYYMSGPIEDAEVLRQALDRIP